MSGQETRLAPFIEKLKRKKIKVSLFIDPNVQEIEAAVNIGAELISKVTSPEEIYCNA